MRHWTWDFVLDWTTRIGRRFGNTVVETQTGKRMDWGQALCREMYGVDWSNSPEWMTENNKDDSEAFDMSAVDRARSWEAGNHPDWCEYDDRGLWGQHPDAKKEPKPRKEEKQ